jgi:hypothetical protein
MRSSVTGGTPLRRAEKSLDIHGALHHIAIIPEEIEALSMDRKPE